MWHVRTDAYLAHLVKSGIVHKDNRDIYADTLDLIRHQHQHLTLLSQCLLAEVYRGPRPKAQDAPCYNSDKTLVFERQTEVQDLELNAKRSA